MKHLIAASLTVLAATVISTGAFAQSAKQVVVKPVAITETGRTVVKANGAMYIQLQPSEYNTQTAQELYERSRAKFRKMILDDQEAFDRKNGNIDQANRAGLYRNTNTNVPTDGFYGIAIPSLEKVSGKRYTLTREERLQQPMKQQSYIIAETDRDSGVVADANCRNPQGRADVLGLNQGNSGCFAQIRVFKKLK